MKVILTSDHAGVELKIFLAKKLLEAGYETHVVGTKRIDQPQDYPDSAQELVDAMLFQGQVKEKILGVGICGTGIGISIALNRNPQIRAALAWSPAVAELAKKHNNANVLCLGARTNIDPEESFSILASWLNAEFEGGRHALRIEKLSGK